ETPAVVILNTSVAPRPKPEAVSELAARVLDPAGGTPNEVSLALLRRDPPAFTPGHGPPSGQFSDDLDEMTSWVHHLNHSYLAIQGPPGTGKTFRGAQIIRSLILAGKRVGITAMSHHAIDNLLEAVIDAFAVAGDAAHLRAVRRGSPPPLGALPGVSYKKSNAPCANANFNLVAGTTWLFAGNDMNNR